MARITIEDCMEKVPNRFHLVQMASIRAKQLKKGARPLLSSDENKQVVMALREIAAGLVKPGEAAPPPETAVPLTPPAPEATAFAPPSDEASLSADPAETTPSTPTGDDPAKVE